MAAEPNDLDLEFLDLEMDPENSGSVRRIEEGFNELDGEWILGFNANRYRYGQWIMTVHFDPNTTNGPANPGGKNSVTIVGIETRTLLSFMKAPSPGTFYLKNFALLPNASGHGGTAMKYATTEFNDLARTFVNEGLDGVIEAGKEKFIPESIQKHISSANKYQRYASNPESFIKDYASRSKKYVTKELGLGKFFKFTKQIFSIGINVAEAVVAPEVFVTKSVRKLGTKTAKNLTAKAKQKTIKTLL